MKILALDVATKVGWALHDTDRPVAAIRCGRFTCKGDSHAEKVRSMRVQLPGIVREHAPDFCAIEEPLQFFQSFKTIRRDLTGVVEHESKNAGQLLQNTLFGAALAIVLGFNVEATTIQPKTWQAIVPKGTGDVKRRIVDFAKALKITVPNQDAADAAIIAVWAAGHCQEVKMLARAS